MSAETAPAPAALAARAPDGHERHPAPAGRRTAPPPFAILLAEHREAVLGFLRALVGPLDAEDCFQETFLAALRAYERMDGAHPRAWLMTIARRKAIDHQRARARRPRPHGGSEQLERIGGAHEPPREPRAEIWAAVASLPEGQRVAVALRYAADLSYREIGTTIGCGEAAARRRVADARRALRVLLEPEGGEDG